MISVALERVGYSARRNAIRTRHFCCPTIAHALDGATSVRFAHSSYIQNRRVHGISSYTSAPGTDPTLRLSRSSTAMYTDLFGRRSAAHAEPVPRQDRVHVLAPDRADAGTTHDHDIQTAQCRLVRAKALSDDALYSVSAHRRFREFARYRESQPWPRESVLSSEHDEALGAGAGGPAKDPLIFARSGQPQGAREPAPWPLAGQSIKRSDALSPWLVAT